MCAYFQQGMAIDLFPIEPCQLDAEGRMEYLDALKLSYSPLKCAEANVTFRVNVVQYLQDRNEKLGSHRKNDIKAFTVKQSNLY